MDHIFTQVEPDIYTTYTKYDLTYNQYRFTINITASKIRTWEPDCDTNKKHSEGTKLHHAKFEKRGISSAKADQDRTHSRLSWP